MTADSVLGLGFDERGRIVAAGAQAYIDQWNASLAAAVAVLGEPGFPAALEQALRHLVAFEMMNGFAYAPGGKAFDLDNDRIVGDRTTIVDHYLAGAYILDPFYDAVRNSPHQGILIMRRLAPDRFTETEYYRRHYQATGIVDEIGFVLKLRHADAVLSLSRIGTVTAFSRRDITRLESAAPVVRALAERHWHGRFTPPDEDAKAAAAISHPLLSKRELEIVTLILKGHSTYSIAATLGLSPNTVKVHRRQAYAKLTISSQAELFHLFLSRN
ncbi:MULTISPECIES: helix-turn-helix transcriptional regulator [unclassified Shinella]|jgi:DNA-binding CsgD family transcriptional regulator|uniref:helix-turn-helix transcriptional regulator n=2 Tax=Shinella TaxID=323620 RepID=UPI00068D8445|nr:MULTISPECIES: helix-turn-helix transcriptional regulator [unclassified Shinella]MCA0339810.1 helix-turn-helix transcriptional regulator [Pseudomonadota bacterium]MCO5152065.1 helix-turn-helix transcriptional regulator [Shinella sp.]MDC7266618.1 helix-turn-helix transcriptional regulator [Shinella sp. HY16]MDC7273515.1 helix-turn-helix transcriptional regulator [Shinella sp. YZ44]MDG4674281.1 helix-turn-helix transcriptional regulator [Shinella sp. 838]